jgi:hypothetical protein
VRRTRSSSASRSRLAPTAWPSRRIESCTRPRSWVSSAKRRSSTRDILLNSSPSAANSSRPTVGTLAEKSPPARRRAAARKAAIWRCSVRDTSMAHMIASRKNPASTPPANSFSGVVEPCTAEMSPIVKTRISWRPNAPLSAKFWTRYSVSPSISCAPSPVGSVFGSRTANVLASTLSPLSTIARRPASERRRRTYVAASTTATPSVPSRRLRSDTTGWTAGAIARRSPTRTIVLPSLTKTMRSSALLSSSRAARRRARSTSPSCSAPVKMASVPTSLIAASADLRCSRNMEIANACCWPIAASAWPVSLSSMSRNSRNATASIGTMTISTKKSARRLRKLTVLSVSAHSGHSRTPGRTYPRVHCRASGL